MSGDVVTLPLEAGRMDAIRLMQEGNVRRIPLVDGDGIAGIVTLDDLILDEAAPVGELAAIVRSQLGQGGPATPARRRAREARAAEGPDRLVTRAAIEGELVQRLAVIPLRAAEILDAVGRTLAQNVSAGQIDDVRGQLPEELRSVFPERTAA